MILLNCMIILILILVSAWWVTLILAVAGSAAHTFESGWGCCTISTPHFWWNRCEWMTAQMRFSSTKCFYFWWRERRNGIVEIGHTPTPLSWRKKVFLHRATIGLIQHFSLPYLLSCIIHHDTWYMLLFSITIRFITENDGPSIDSVLTAYPLGAHQPAMADL